MTAPLNGWQRRILQKLEKATRRGLTTAEIATAMGYRPERTTNGNVSKTLKRMLRGDAGPDIPVVRIPPAAEGEPNTWVITSAGRRLLAQMEEDEQLVRICAQRVGETAVPVEWESL